MPKEFTYSQRKTTDSYRKGWEKAFRKQAEIETDKASKRYNKKVTDMVFRTRVGIKTETTEQKQPSLND